MPITEIVEVDEEKPELEDALDDVIEGEPDTDGDEVDGEGADDTAETDGADAEADEVVVSIDGEEPAQEEDAKAPQWVKELRKNQRDLQRENRELKKKLEQGEKAAPKVEPVGKRPTLEDFDYDAEKYDAAIDAWYKRKQTAEQAENAAKEQEVAQQQAWQKKLDHFAECKQQLKVQNFQEAESAVFAALNVTQQGIIVQGADNPAAIVYALNAHPTKLAELAGMKDPVQFAFAVSKLETKLKMTPRTSVPPPERRVTGSGGKGSSLDNTLEKLRATAEKTGDYTEVTRFKAEQRKKQG